MSVSPLQNFISTIAARGTNALQNSASATPTVPSANASAASADVTSVNTQAAGNASLRDTSISFAQLNSLLQVAQAGTQQLGTLLTRLQTLALQSVGGNNISSDEFQQLLAQIDQVVGGFSFGSNNLLDGSFAASSDTTSNGTASDSASLSLPNLTAQGLFGNEQPSIATPQAAASAAAALANALGTVSDTSDNIASIQAQLSFSSANVDTALNNQQAASSTLTESDLSGGSVGLLEQFLTSPADSARAQTGNLSPSLLGLIQE